MQKVKATVAGQTGTKKNETITGLAQGLPFASFSYGRGQARVLLNSALRST